MATLTPDAALELSVRNTEPLEAEAVTDGLLIDSVDAQLAPMLPADEDRLTEAALVVPLPVIPFFAEMIAASMSPLPLCMLPLMTSEVFGSVSWNVPPFTADDAPRVTALELLLDTYTEPALEFAVNPVEFTVNGVAIEPIPFVPVKLMVGAVAVPAPDIVLLAVRFRVEEAPVKFTDPLRI